MRCFIAKSLLLASLTAFAGQSLAAGKCERLVATGSPDAPPYLWRDPQHPTRLIGVSADLLTRVAAELGIQVELLYGGKRSQALEEVNSGRMDLLIDAPLTVAGLDTLDYVHPALVQNDYLVWTRKGSSLNFRSLADLHGYPGAMSAKSRPTHAFELLANERLQLTRPDNLTQTLQQLLLGKVDYVIAGRYSAGVVARTLGMGNDLQASEQPVDRPGLYVALSHDSACNEPWLRGQLAKKMTELAASGLAQEVLQRNLDRWQAEQVRPVGDIKKQ